MTSLLDGCKMGTTVVETWHGIQYTVGEERERKEGGKMLSLEIIGVLGFVYIFLAIGALRAILARRAVRRKSSVKAKPVVTSSVAGAAK